MTKNGRSSTTDLANLSYNFGEDTLKLVNR